MDKGKKLHFMHIPKTGGTSLSQFLEKQFKMEEVCPLVYLRYADDRISPAKILNNEFDENLRKYRFFKGHLGWVPRSFFLDEEVETVTFLRAPVARALSVYNAKRTQPYWHYISKQWSCLEDFIDDKTFGLESHSNIQTKHFCADHYFKKSFSYSEPDKILSGTGGIFSNLKIDLSPNQQLELAIERLHRCAFVGMTEHYEESLHWLCLQYGWFPPKSAPKRNVSTKFTEKSDLAPHLVDRILELNQLDFILYREAHTIFNDRKKTRVACNNSNTGKNIIKKIATDNVLISFEDSFIGEGWDAREGISPNLFCWSVATPSTLLVSMKSRRNFSLSFHVLHWLVPELEKNLTLTVNSLPIPLVHHQPPEGGTIFNGIIPAKVFHAENSLLELSFSIPKLIRPMDINPNSMDSRELGFACKGVSIKPLTPLQYIRYCLRTISNKMKLQPQINK